MRILSIETSCDETSIAIVEFPNIRKSNFRILSHIISSQLKLHAKYGGVVPNLAKREHQKNLPFILKRALKEGGFSIFNFHFSIFKKILNSKLEIINNILEREPELLKRFKKQILPLKSPPLDAIAVTVGPGLAPALWVGVNFARALSYLWNKPIIPVNHMLGHLYSALLQSERRISNSQIPISKQIPNFKFQIQNAFEFRISNFEFPAIALLVSGGHTELVLVDKGPRKSASGQRESTLTYKIVGETLDDAAGEAFDKVARMLGLKYPGGPEISKLSQTISYEARPRKIILPRPMINSKNYNFSFSGLKTAALYLINDLKKKYPLAKIRPAVANEFQNAVVEVLVAKTLRAAKAYKAKSVLLGGGVAANILLRKTLANKLSRELPHVSFLISPLSLTGDNALMIALAAYFAGKKKPWSKIQAEANLRLK